MKRYILDRLHRVKEVFRREIEEKDQLKAKDFEFQASDEAVPVQPLPNSETTEEETPHAVLNVQGSKPSNTVESPRSSGPKTFTDKSGRTQVTWTEKGMKKVRKIMEICTWTMMISSLAVERDPEHWNVCKPITIETGYNLLTKSGRKKADKYLAAEKPDLIVAEWMCSPFSSTQNLNLGKGGALRERILQEQRKHTKVNLWIAEKEKLQR